MRGVEPAHDHGHGHRRHGKPSQPARQLLNSKFRTGGRFFCTKMLKFSYKRTVPCTKSISIKVIGVVLIKGDVLVVYAFSDFLAHEAQMPRLVGKAKDL